MQLFIDNDEKEFVQELRHLIKKDYSGLKEIDGAFLLAFYDQEKKKGILFKSLLCQRSLFYRQEEDKLIFSSKIEEVFTNDPLLDQINKDMIVPLVLGDVTNSKESYFSDVYRLLAGEILIFEEGKAEVEKLDQLKYREYRGNTIADYMNIVALSDIDKDMLISKGNDSIRFFDLFLSRELMEWSIILYDEMSVLDTRIGAYYQLNKSAQIMWNAILNSRNDSEAIMKIFDQIEGEEEEMRIEYQEFKKKLISEGWIDFYDEG